MTWKPFPVDIFEHMIERERDSDISEVGEGSGLDPAHIHSHQFQQILSCFLRLAIRNGKTMPVFSIVILWTNPPLDLKSRVKAIKAKFSWLPYSKSPALPNPVFPHLLKIIRNMLQLMTLQTKQNKAKQPTLLIPSFCILAFIWRKNTLQMGESRNTLF